MSLVIDSSVALAWCFEDERTPATVGVLEHVARVGAVAPALWPLEVLNVLVLAERRGRLTAAQRLELAGFLRDLPLELDHETAAQSWNTTARLAQRHRLTLYDAAYLELALRLGLPLATLDRELRAVAAGLGVQLLGEDASG